MPHIVLSLDGDLAWSDLNSRPDVINAGEALSLAALAGGMASGRTSVAVRVDLPDGGVVITQTSLEALTAAVRALNVRYPDG